MIKDAKKEYLVQITVIEARCLKPKNSSGLSNPFVKIKCGNLPVQTTEVIWDRLEANWNQSFTFEGLKMTEQELQTTDLVVEVYSKNNFFSNDLIGLYSLGLSTLYKNANHEFYNMWLVLYNQDEDPEEAQGYLLIDAFIIGPGDRPPVHDRNEKVNQDVAEEDEDLNIDEMTFEQLRAYQEKQQSYTIIGKPMVARKGFQLSVYIFKCENLAYFDGKKPNAFISSRVAGLVRRTKSVKSNANPLYNQKMLFPCFFPFLNDKILLRIWNERGNSRDDFIANIPELQSTNDFFNLSKLIAMGGRMPAKWINLYGIPDTERNSTFKTKVKHPKEGTAYMGRIMLSFSLIPHEAPTCGTIPCNQFYEQDPQSYNLFCDIYELKYLKEDQYDIAVWCECSIGPYKTGINVQKKPSKKGSVRWNITEQLNEITLPSITHIYFPKEYNQIPDIFVNLYTGCGQSNSRRIGYIRLKAEEVNRWTAEAVPRWLHFKPLDMNKDSPGSVLINLQFMPSGESTKRIFKQTGITKKYILYAHIVNGFELCPKQSMKDEDLKTRIKVEISDESTYTKEVKVGRYPMWNEILQIVTELDWKLDFTPDVVVTCYKKVPKGIFNKDEYDEEEIGRFTVPVCSIKKMKKYPHYFNLIKNNEITGRLMAMFYIIDYKSKSIGDKFGIIKTILDKKQLADIKVFTLGMRNLDFPADINKTKFDVYLTTDESSTIKPVDNENLALEKINPKGEENNFLNILNCYEFKDVEIRGDETFQIYPFIKLNYTHKKMFYDEERFLIFNLNEFVSSVSENKKKLYRILFEQNLGVTSLDQSQKIIPKDVVEDDLINVAELTGEEGDEDQKYNTNENFDVLAVFDKKKPEPEEEKIIIKEYDGNEEKKLAYLIKTYKNMVVGDMFNLECKPKDKAKEKEVMRKLRKNFYAQIRSLRKIENPSMEQRNRLLDLEEKFRDAKKPQMNEPIFYGFEDIADEYNYGRDIYKEDVYESHPNFVIPYKRRSLYHIPRNPFDQAYETLEGYFKLGKLTNNLIKFNVDLQFKNKEQIQTKQTTPTKTAIFSAEEALEEEVDKELEQYNIFNSTYQEKLRFLYLNKDEKRINKVNDFKLPLNALKVRVYIYRCLNLTAQDNFIGFVDYMAGYNSFSQANAYLQIQVGQDSDVKEKGTKFIETKDSYVANSLSPDFYQMYELEADLPKDWKLQINVMSFTPGGGSDSLIGSTVIDLEDRYLGENRTRKLIGMKSYESDLMEQLRKYENPEIERDESIISKLNSKLSILNRKIDEVKENEVPVEYRPLTKPGVSTAQGIIEMFVEILPQSRAKMIKPAKIERPPPEEYEMRLVIWETRGLPYEGGKKSIDAMITVSYDPEGYLSEDVQKQTDVHLGCTDGKAIFNWRMKFDLQLPCTFPRLTFDVRDFNTFSSDEALCSCTISVKRLIKKLVQDGRLEIKNKWIQLGNRNDPGETKGEIKIDLYFLQKSEADQNPVGEAQDEPNHDPKLEKPKVGRGITDFLKGTWLDVTSWKFNFSLFGTLKILVIVAIIVVLFVILFVQPGILVK